MKNIFVFGASNSKKSINQQLAVYAAGKLKEVKITTVDLNDFEMPIYSVDKETENGIPQLAKDFNQKMSTADGFVVSFAEYNGAYTSAFKNIFDWVSRVNPKMWNDKPTVFLATSPGARGGLTVLEIAAGRMSYHGAVLVGTFSLPSFGDNFKDGAIVNQELDDELTNLMVKLQKKLTKKIVMEFSKEVNAAFDSEHNKAVLNLKHTANFINALGNKELEPYQITTAQYNILRILKGAKKAITMKLVKERMIEKSPNTTRLIDKLCDKEFVHRIRCKEDKRVIYVSITEKGLTLLDKFSFKSTIQQMQNLTNQEARKVNELLDKIRA